MIADGRPTSVVGQVRARASRQVRAPRLRSDGTRGAQLGTAPASHGPLVCIAPLVPASGIDVLVRALVLQPPHLPRRVEVFGDGPLRLSLEALARLLDLGDHVRLLGMPATAGLADALARAGIVVAPCRAIVDDAVDGAIALARALGVPVVATAPGGARAHLVGAPGVVVVPSEDPAALAAAIARLRVPGHASLEPIR